MEARPLRDPAGFKPTEPNPTNTRCCVSGRAAAPSLGQLDPTAGPFWGLGARQVSLLALMLAAEGSRDASGSPRERTELRARERGCTRRAPPAAAGSLLHVGTALN